jgi:DNA polymerase III sliding clamp (beta) subunit (PCNA family)
MLLAVHINNAKNLKTPLANVAAAANKTTLIETCVLLTGVNIDGKSDLTMTAVDSKTHQLTLRVPDADVASEGRCIVPAPLFNDMIRKCRDEPVDLGVNDDSDSLLIQTRTRINLNLFGEPVENFPVVTELPPVVTTTEADVLVKAIKDAIALAGKDNYVTFVGEGKELRIYTNSDGRMFSRTVINTSGTPDHWAVSVGVTLLARLPGTWSGTCCLHLDANCDNFAISVGAEHLIIKQLLTDTVSGLVDGLIAENAEAYWVIKTESLMDDLGRAASIQDKRGLRLRREADTLRAYCQAPGKGSLDTPHMLVDHDGTIREMYVDPKLLERALKSLQAVDVVGEQVAVNVPAVVEGMPDEESISLLLKDQDTPEFRQVIVSTLEF